MEDEFEKHQMRAKIQQLEMDLKLGDAGKQAWVDTFDELLKENIKLQKHIDKIEDENKRLKEEIESLKKS
jgi:cell division protein FtsB